MTRYATLEDLWNLNDRLMALFTRADESGRNAAARVDVAMKQADTIAIELRLLKETIEEAQLAKKQRKKAKKVRRGHK